MRVKPGVFEELVLLRDREIGFVHAQLGIFICGCAGHRELPVPKLPPGRSITHRRPSSGQIVGFFFPETASTGLVTLSVRLNFAREALMAAAFANRAFASESAFGVSVFASAYAFIVMDVGHMPPIMPFFACAILPVTLVSPPPPNPPNPPPPALQPKPKESAAGAPCPPRPPRVPAATPSGAGTGCTRRSQHAVFMPAFSDAAGMEISRTSRRPVSVILSFTL